MRWQDHITRDPDVMLGKPVIRGTRLTVEQLLERSGGGGTEAALLADYPRLRPEHIRAAQACAAAGAAGHPDLFAPELTLWYRRHASTGSPWTRNR